MPLKNSAMEEGNKNVHVENKEICYVTMVLPTSLGRWALA